MDDDFFRRDYDQGPQKRDNLFLWTVFILLLAGFAIACWLGSFYIFGHPENPRSYKILLKLHKIDPPKRFEYTAAPTGEFLTPQKFYEKYATMPDYQFQEANAGFLRDYIRNYQATKNLVPYLIGRFTILNARALKEGGDLFPTGVVALAQASEYPQVMVEYVYTSAPDDVAQLKEMLAPGLDIKLEKTLDLSAVIHIEKLNDGRLLLTAVPLLYGSYTLKQGNGSFSLEPPAKLNLEAGVPFSKANAIPPAGRNYAAAHPASTPAEGTDGGDASGTPAPTPSGPELVRVMAPVAVNSPAPVVAHPTPEPTPAMAVATPPPATPPPQPVAVATPVAVPIPIPVTPPPRPVVVATPPPNSIIAQNTTPGPIAIPVATPGEVVMPPSPAPTPVPAVAAANPDVQLHPFIEAKPTPAVAMTGGAWKVFRPGQMPRGRLLKPSDATALADKGTGGERLYLSGQFVVTASGENSAVLRPKAGTLTSLNPLGQGVQARIIVEFPAGYQPPAEGVTFSRDEMRPFEIRDVQRARDGTINVMVREITTPE